MKKKLKLSQVEVDETFLPRDEYRKEEIEQYAEYLKNGEDLSPIVVFKDKDDRYILASGRLRFEAHKEIEAIKIDVVIKEGSDHDRIVESIESNSKHGLRLSKIGFARIPEIAVLPIW